MGPLVVVVVVVLLLLLLNERETVILVLHDPRTLRNEGYFLCLPGSRRWTTTSGIKLVRQ